MIKRALYRYLGTNGVIDSPIEIPNAYSIEMTELVASPRHLLVNGDQRVSRIVVAANKVKDWKEIAVDEIE